jgi:hypothetical protein
VIPPPSLDPKDATNVTWAGRGDDLTYNGPPSVTRWNNRVAAGTDYLVQTSGGLYPTEISDTFGGDPSTVPGVHMGAGGSLDQFENATQASSMIGASTWHIFALIQFGAISADDPASPHHNHAIFAQCDKVSGSYTSNFALTLRNASDGPVTGKVAQAYFNGSSSSLIQVACTESVPHLLEWWGDGSDQHLRVDDSAIATLGISGAISFSPEDDIRLGSVNFEGGWDNSLNRIYELISANAVIPEAESVRNYFATRYNVAV